MEKAYSLGRGVTSRELSEEKYCTTDSHSALSPLDVRLYSEFGTARTDLSLRVVNVEIWLLKYWIYKLVAGNERLGSVNRSKVQLQRSCYCRHLHNVL